jgi:two-component system LytT family response regulator
MKIISPVNSSQTGTLRPLNRYNTKLCISTKKTNLIIEKSQICFLKSDSNYCEIHLFDGSIHLCSKTLKEIAGRIRNHAFIRVHQSYVINVNAMKSIDASYDQLTLLNGSGVPISRGHKAELKATIQLYFD